MPKKLFAVVAAAIVTSIFLVSGTSSAEPEPQSTKTVQDTPETSTARSTIRLWGESRMGTAVQISQNAFPDGSRDVFLARMDNFPDALAGGSLTSGPILLVPSGPKGPLSPPVAEEINRLDPERVIALGGPEAVPSHILENAADVTGIEPSRLAGPDRFATAVEIAKYAFDTADKAYLVRGDDFPDALAAGALDDGPVLLVPPDGNLPSSVDNYLSGNNPGEIVALGGRSAVSNSMLEQASDASGGAKMLRIAGENRIETAVAISQYAFDYETMRVVIARTDDFPDALAASALGRPILLTHTHTLPSRVLNEVKRLDPWTVIAVGGRSAISDNVLAEAAEL